jgi:hypothetical protein
MTMRLANSVNASYPYVLRGALQQTDTGLLWLPPGWTQRTGMGATISDNTDRCGCKIGAFELHNRSGGNVNAGIGFRLNNRFWGAGTATASEAAFTRVAAFQSRVATAFQVTGADQTGLIVYATVPFSWVSLNITTAETNAGGATVVDHSVKYYTSSGFTAITTGNTFADSFTKTNGVWAAGEGVFVWQPQVDWIPYDGTNGIPKGMYAMSFTCAEREANDVAAIMTGMEIGTGLFLDTLADNAIWENETTAYKQAEADAVVAFFSVASPMSRVYVETETA